MSSFEELTAELEARYLVAERLGGDEGDLLDDPLVGVEVESELGVVLLDDDTCGLLHSFGSDATHGGVQREICKVITLDASGKCTSRCFQQKYQKHDHTVTQVSMAVFQLTVVPSWAHVVTVCCREERRWI